jgi:RNA polymerase sigma-70 factor (ECF subfamily)
MDSRKGTVGTWLSAITRNLAIDSLRMRLAEPVDPGLFLTLAAADNDPIDQVTRRQDMERVCTAVRGLPQAQQRALLLSAFFGRTAAEVSRMEQVPLGTAKTRIRTATLKLRTTLSEHYKPGQAGHALPGSTGPPGGARYRRSAPRR